MSHRDEATFTHKCTHPMDVYAPVAEAMWCAYGFWTVLVSMWTVWKLVHTSSEIQAECKIMHST